MSSGLGVIWTCDNCGATAETNLDDVPLGWLDIEVDEDDYAEDEEIPWDLVLCDKCRAPGKPPTSELTPDAQTRETERKSA